ncbi:hypothetical protein CVT24_011095, partial [Panaeolus cyanescens]
PPQVGIADLPTPLNRPFSHSLTPTTSEGIALLAALRTCEEQLQDSNKRLLTLHASNLLNHKYAHCIHNRLEEVKKQQKGNTRFVVKGATVLTNEQVIEEVRQRDEARRVEDANKAKRDTGRQRYHAEVKKWEKEKVVAENEKKKKAYKAAVAKWEKAKGEVFRTKKPKQGPLTKHRACPLLKDFIKDNEEEEEEAKISAEEEVDDDRGEEEEDAAGSDSND